MKLLIKQRVFSWTDTYDVYDENENRKYFVKTEMFRIGHQIHVYDAAGNEIGMIKQRVFTLLPCFDRRNSLFSNHGMKSIIMDGDVKAIL